MRDTNTGVDFYKMRHYTRYHRNDHPLKLVSRKGFVDPRGNRRCDGQFGDTVESLVFAPLLSVHIRFISI